MLHKCVKMINFAPVINLTKQIHKRYGYFATNA